MAKAKYYAVAHGRKSGIFVHEPDARASVERVQGAKWKSFPTISACESWLMDQGCRDFTLHQRASGASGSTSSSSGASGSASASSAAAAVVSPASASSSAPPQVPSADAEYTLYFDGGARNNGSSVSPAGAGMVLKSGAGHTLWRGGRWLGTSKTNNEAEYHGLIDGLQGAAAKGVKRLRVVGDSELILKQMRGLYDVKAPNLQPLHAQAKRLAAGFTHIAYQHVLRRNNSEADAAANEAMDTRSSFDDHCTCALGEE